MSADPARKRSWPVQGHVAIVSAEAQTHVLLPVQIVEALPESEREVLRTVGQVEWLTPEPVLHELQRLLGRVTGVDREIVKNAIELVEYDCKARSGVAVAPPPG